MEARMPSAAHEAHIRNMLELGLRARETVPTEVEVMADRVAQQGALPAPPSDVIVEDVTLGGVPCVTVSIDSPSDVSVVYLHGGGYIWLSARSLLPAAVGLVRATGARCVLVDYRLAPEHPYPAPVEDSVSVYVQILADGTASEKVFLAGDSAGGGLVLATLVAARDQGLDRPAGGICFSPWTDLAVTGATADSVDDPVVSGASLRMMASLYLAGADPHSATASPLYAD